MRETADVIIVGAGVQGASLAFHLNHRGIRVLVVEMATVAAGATGRSSGFVRMHYDLATDAALAWRSFPYFQHWGDLVGSGDCGFVRTGFIQLVPTTLSGALRANVAMQQEIGILTEVVTADQVGDLVPGIVTDDFAIAAYEPQSGYADPSGTAAGFLAAARAAGVRLIQGCRAVSVLLDGDTVQGVETDQGRFAAPVVVDAAGAWAAEIAAHRRRRGADPDVAPRHGVLRPARRASRGLPDRHRRDEPGLLPA